ncbi:hypothetical protein Pelo_18862 [Pelomyxa schiedti]|nr:hypothetical protein Pelo_18862 [Pelomyxa schiedti]
MKSQLFNAKSAHFGGKYFEVKCSEPALEMTDKKVDMRKLTKEDRNLLMELAKQGKTTKDIAATMDIPEEKIKQWQARQDKKKPTGPRPKSRRRASSTSASSAAIDLSDVESDDPETQTQTTTPTFTPESLITSAVQRCAVVTASFAPCVFATAQEVFILFPVTNPRFQLQFFIEWDEKLVVVKVVSPPVPETVLSTFTNGRIAQHLVADRTSTIKIAVPIDFSRIDRSRNPQHVGPNVELPNLVSTVAEGLVIYLKPLEEQRTGLQLV